MRRLFRTPGAGTSPLVSDREIFERTLRRRRRDRAAPRFADHAFLRDHILDELLARLDGVTRRFERALDLGSADGAAGDALRARGMTVASMDAGFTFARVTGGVQGDEDRLPFADGSFDLVVSAGGLDQVNDLPGALALIRRALRPDGLLLAGFVGAGSLPKLRAALMRADLAVTGSVAARIHPQIDVRAAGDLLSRAGFALPVADTIRLDVRYADPWRLIADLRGMAATNLLRSRAPMMRGHLAPLAEAFMAAADDDGRVRETFEIVCLTAWSPSPDQPKPARRGSATASLTEALRPKQ